MIEYVIGQTSDREEIIEFINMVFSQDIAPHNFKQLLPKLYSDAVDTSSCHYLVKKDGKIKAVVGVFPANLYVGERTLKIGHVGSVSVHGDSRGKGYMKNLMNLAVQDSKKQNYDALVLGGFKNRYQYFGFQPTEIVLKYIFIKENIRHALKNIEVSDICFEKVSSYKHPYLKGMRRLYESQVVYSDRGADTAAFYRVLQSWESEIYAIRKGEDYIGYCCSNSEGTCFREIYLEDTEWYGVVLKAWFAYKNISQLSTSCAVFEVHKNEVFGKYCENYSISAGHSWNILNFTKVAEAFMKLKSTYEPLEEGMLTLEIEAFGSLIPDETCQLKYGDSEIDCKYLRLDRLDAVEGMFSPMALYRNYGKCQGVKYKNWFPLSLYMADLDAC